MINILDTRYLHSFCNPRLGLNTHYFDITLIDPDTTDNDLYKLEAGVYGLVCNNNINMYKLIDNDGTVVIRPETHVLAMIDHCARYAEEYL